jgi:L-lactate dehydrogenase complex protein LldG
MSAREAILGRIRKAQGRDGTAPTAADLAKIRADIARREWGPQPAIARPVDAVAQFRAECDRLGTTHSHADDAAQVPAQVALYLDALGLERRIVSWPAFAALDWDGAGIAFEDRPANGHDRTGLTGCFGAIAETGTVLLLGGEREPKSTALLPETHICVVRRSRLVNTMEASFAMLRAECRELPRATWFVSGPSRTADIEQTIVIGAHGPYRVHVVLVP